MRIGCFCKKIGVAVLVVIIMATSISFNAFAEETPQAFEGVGLEDQADTELGFEIEGDRSGVEDEHDKEEFNPVSETEYIAEEIPQESEEEVEISILAADSDDVQQDSSLLEEVTPQRSQAVSSVNSDFVIDENGILTLYKGTDEHVVVPDNVKGIGRDAFMYYEKLKTVSLPEGLNSIGIDAFYYCTNLTSITIPANVTEIHYSSFLRCDSLENIYVASGNKTYTSIDGVLYNKDQTVILRYPQGNKRKAYTIPNTVKTVGEYAFGFSTYLKEITISNSVNTLEKSSFTYCDNLYEIVIPDSVTSIERWAFYKCDWLHYVTLSKNIDVIEDSVFSNCHSLYTIKLPENLTKIGEQAFAFCNYLKLYIPPSVTYIGDKCFNRSTIWVHKDSVGHKYALENESSFFVVELDKPASLKEIEKTQTTISIQWPAVYDSKGNYAYYYEVARSTSKNGKYETLDTSKASGVSSDGYGSFKDIDLISGNTYYYKVRAYNSIGDYKFYSSYSEVVEVTTSFPILEKVTSLTVKSSGYNALKLTWDSEYGANGYEIRRATSKNGTYSKIKTTTGTSYTDENLTNGETYYYKVRAFYKGNEKTSYGSYSSISSGKPIQAKATSVKASKVNAVSNKITWKKASGATGYQVYAATSKNGKYKKVATISTGKTSYTHKNLTTGKQYYYKVRAYKKADKKTYLSAYSGIVTAKPMPVKPTNFSIKKSGTTGAKLAWTKSSGVTGYQVYVSTSKTGTYKKAGTTKSSNITLKNLKKGNKYYYKVRAYKKVGKKTYYSGYTGLKSISIK